MERDSEGMRPSGVAFVAKVAPDDTASEKHLDSMQKAGDCDTKGSHHTWRLAAAAACGTWPGAT